MNLKTTKVVNHRLNFCEQKNYPTLIQHRGKNTLELLTADSDTRGLAETIPWVSKGIKSVGLTMSQNHSHPSREPQTTIPTLKNAKWDFCAKALSAEFKKTTRLMPCLLLIFLLFRTDASRFFISALGNRVQNTAH